MTRAPHISPAFVPVFVLFLLLLDKVSCIPIVRDYGRPNLSDAELSIRYFANLIQEAKTKDSRPVVVNLGTSRTMMLRSVNDDSIRASRYLTAAEKKTLGGYQFITPAFASSDYFMLYAVMKGLLREGIHPDVAVVELSPEMLNASNPSRVKYVNQQILPYSDVWEMARLTNGEIRMELLKRLLFASYAYKVHPERAVWNAIRGTSYKDQIARQLDDMSKLYVYRLDEAFTDYAEDDIPPDIYQKKFVDYAHRMGRLKFMRNYKKDESQVGLFIGLLNMLKAENIRIVVWYPVLHKEWTKQLEDVGAMPDLKELELELLNGAWPYFNGAAYAMKCRRYIDSSHISSSCAPYLLYHILNTR